MRKRRRIEEEEEDEEDEEEEEEMEEGKMSVIRSDLPPGRQEHQELKEHTNCLANHTNSNDIFLRQLKMDMSLFMRKGTSWHEITFSGNAWQKKLCHS